MVKIYIAKIVMENIIICSLGMPRGDKRIIRAASRVPIPEIETGIRVMRPAIVTENAR